MITYHDNIEQGTEEWKALRCGVITASQMHLLMTPTMKPADNDKSRSHLYELAAQRITRFVEEQFVSDAMARGSIDEVFARKIYSDNYAPITECGFVTRQWPEHGLTIGYSPDGLVPAGKFQSDGPGLIEIKSRAQKYQVRTILDHVISGKSQTIPDDYVLQIQTGLLVTDREWCDFISYCGGMPMVVIRVYADREMQDKILQTAIAANDKINAWVSQLGGPMPLNARLFQTPRFQEVIL